MKSLSVSKLEARLDGLNKPLAVKVKKQKFCQSAKLRFHGVRLYLRVCADQLAHSMVGDFMLFSAGIQKDGYPLV